MNVELAQQGLKDAERHLEQFRMSAWISRAGLSGAPPVFTKDAEDFVPPCGTTACYAGWISFRAAPMGTVINGIVVREPGNVEVHVEDYATAKLDITRDQANTIFFLSNLDEVKAAVGYLADNPDADGDTLWHVARPDDPDDWDADLDGDEAFSEPGQ